MLTEAELRDALQKISPVAISGPFSRFVPFRHLVSARREGFVPSPRAKPPRVSPERKLLLALWGEDPSPTPKPLWGVGSLENGGRYNFAKKFEVVYLAEDAITALAENELMLRHASARIVRIKGAPLVHISVEGTLVSVLDLTLTHTQELLSTNMQELTGEWRAIQVDGQEAPTQVLGRVAFESERFDAIRFPSSKNPGGVCVAVFAERLTADGRAFIAVYDPDDNLAQRIPPG